MGIRKQITCWLVLLGSFSSHAVIGSDQFGRLFTTQAQRSHMNELRKANPALLIQFEQQTIDIEEDVEEIEETPVNALTVRGLVYRSDGNSTAWINDSNTFEGGISSQYISVGNIETNNVQIKIPSTNTIVNLNVGQTFDPVSEDFKDLVEESAGMVNDVSQTEKKRTSPRP